MKSNVRLIADRNGSIPYTPENILTQTLRAADDLEWVVVIAMPKAKGEQPYIGWSRTPNTYEVIGTIEIAKETYRTAQQVDE